jgi:hypothetical protein
VRLLSIMGGAFPPLLAEYNIKFDLAAATQLFAEWPTEVVASGFEIGEAVLYPAASIENDFGYVEHHPVADAYRAYKKMPYDRPSWDLTPVLYAVRPERGYFNLSPPGSIRVDADGITRFTPGEKGKHRFLVLKEPATLVACVRRARQQSRQPARAGLKCIQGAGRHRRQPADSEIEAVPLAAAGRHRPARLRQCRRRDDHATRRNCVPARAASH